jgi:catechol 2,3-dioxygenase
MMGAISSDVRLLEERRPEMKLAHAGHAELRVKNFEASRRFFTETMGLFVTDEDSECVYLRAWQDWEHHTLMLRRGDTSALEHLG